MKDDSIHIRQLTVEDWELFRDLRLQALKECQRVYLGTYEEGKKRTDTEWQDILKGEDKAVFALFDGQKPIVSPVFLQQETILPAKQAF